jgi:hypothetical protein
MSEEIQKHLVGATITSALLDEGNDYFGFRVEKDGKTFSVWVDKDPEGNGCGHLNIEN